MRFHRIAIENWRGTERRTVDFGTGITILVGPNECGKSSLFEAIAHLFELKASSKHRDMKSVQPAGRDVGPSVELDFEFGPYRVVYRKRWLVRPESELRVLQPRVEQYTGDEAHDRMEALLAEHCDLQLWKALCVRQGFSGDPAHPGSAASLAAALESRRRAAGVEADAPELWDGVVTAFEEHWTNTGLPTQDRRALREALDERRRTVADYERKVEELEDTIERLAKKRASLAEMSASEPRLRSERDAMAGDVARLERAEREHELEKQKLDAATTDLRAAQGQLDRRAELRAEITKRDRDAVKWRGERTRLDAEVRIRESAARDAELADQSAREALERAKDAVTWERLALEAIDAAREIERAIDERTAILADKDRVEKSEADANALDVGEAAIETLTEAQEAVRNAEAALRAEGGSIRIDASDGIRFALDDRPITVARGGTFDVSFGAETRLEIPSFGSIRVRAGEPVAKRQAECAEARQRFATACRDAGVESLEDAVKRRGRADAVRARAEEARERLEGAIKKVLRPRGGLKDLGEASDRAIAVIEGARIEADARARSARERLPKDFAQPADRVDADLRLRAAHDTEGDAQRFADTTHRALVAARDAYAEANVDFAKAKSRLDAAESELVRATETLAQLELAEPEAALRESVAARAQAVLIHKAAVADARRTIDTLDGESVRARFRNAEQRVVDTKDRIAQATNEIASLEGSVVTAGGDGLHERLGAADAESRRAAAALDARDRRARAAFMLHDVVSGLRARNRERYAAPLVERIETLGRPLFGAEFRVELDDALEIATRTYMGRRLDFGTQSSTGAKEQLGLLHRLACAQLVSAEGPMPLVFDDVLGASDPERIDRMSVVLATSGSGAQIILVTSDPRRYQGIGGATVIEL